MTADIIIVFAVIAGIVWLGLMLVSALRNRGGVEEVASNLQPGMDDQHLETRRLERGQKAAIAFSAFLAISLPLYFLSEDSRQEGFVEEFDTASEERGEDLVEEFACFDCHGPLGAGGSADFVEQRSGVSISWTAPALDDILYHYNEDEVNFWITYGRGNTPMPGWGVDGGGPMNEQQVEDVVNYLDTIQRPQQEVVDDTVGIIDDQLSRLRNADSSVQTAIYEQAQEVAEIDQAPEDVAVIEPLVERAIEVQENAQEGIDTDADGLSDGAEAELSEISSEAVGHFTVFEPVTLDPETADADLVDEALAELEALAENDPIFHIYIDRVESALESDEITEDNPDSDDDGISDSAEGSISGLFSDASSATVPSALSEIDLDPTSPESVSGVPDTRTASTMIGGLETVAINTRVTVDNEPRIREQQEAGLAFLEDAQEEKAWEIDFAGVAEAMDSSEEDAQRAVALFNGYCARCHTSGFSAGLPYTQEAGSGGFGPALWDGRPVVQFGDAPEDPEEPDLLVDFLINGSEAEAPYGLNGFGSGRMPGFGAILDQDDIELLTRYLRAGNLDGKDDSLPGIPEAGE
ncbi:MAG: c-type cytochrome [Actinomycetota bacterium]